MYYRKLFFALSFLGLLTSCVAQSASNTGLTKYQQAMVQYEAQQYYAAAQLLEEALPQLRGKSDEASAHFYWAYCRFYQKKYVQSTGRFKYFRKNFLRDPRLEEALYMQAHALSYESLEERLDQNFTKEAVYLFHKYLQEYPSGAYANEARTQWEELNDKLALKDFNGAVFYHQMAYYQAAVVALKNFQNDFPLSSHNEKIAYLKADAQYCYSQEVPEAEKQEALSTAMTYCQELLDNYPDSSYVEAVENIYNKLSSCQ